MKIKSFSSFVRQLNETSLSSDWDADYGLSQGPIDSDKKLNIDLTAGLYAQEDSEYDFETEEDGSDLELEEEKPKKKETSLKDLKTMVDSLAEKIKHLEESASA